MQLVESGSWDRAVRAHVFTDGSYAAEAATGGSSFCAVSEYENGSYAFTTEGREEKMVDQICGVHHGLMYGSKVVKAGTWVVFDAEWSYIGDKKNGGMTSPTENEEMLCLLVHLLLVIA